MNVILVSKEKTEVKFSFEVNAEVLEKGMKFSYNKHKGQISIPGFRKGKVPRKLIESQYGESFFFEDAINHIFPEEYISAMKELELDVVSAPTLDVEYIETGKGAKFVVDVTVKPEVKLGTYKGLSTEKVETVVTEEEVIAQLNTVQAKNARTIEVADRKTILGDIVKLSYAGSVDGVPFDGGQADEHDLELGSNTFIPGFEEQVVGHDVGESFDVTVTFPEEYHSAELAGKEAVFAIVIQSVTAKELPELNDEFAEDVSEFSTLDEYKTSIMDKLAKEKEEKASQEQKDKLLDIALETCEIEVPEVMYSNKVDSMLKEFENNITRQGLSLEIYCQYIGTTIDEMKVNFRESSVKSVDARLMLEEIAKVEKLAIPDEALSEEVCKYGESYGIDAKTMLEMITDEDKEALEKDMLVRAAANLIEETATFTTAE